MLSYFEIALRGALSFFLVGLQKIVRTRSYVSRRLARMDIPGLCPRLALLFLLTSFCVSAQESAHAWRVLGRDYNTQEEAERAITQQGGRFSYYKVIRNETVTENSISFNYWMGKEISYLRDWIYIDYDEQGSLVILENEQASVNAVRARFSKISSNEGCSPNNTYYFDGDWSAYMGWSDGVSYSEVREVVVNNQRRIAGACQAFDSSAYISRIRTRCSNDYLGWHQEDNTCYYDDVVEVRSTPVACHECSLAGDPTDVTTGDQFETESDIASLSWISLERYYHSATSRGMGNLGPGWTHSHAFRLAIGTGSAPSIGYIRPNGSQLPFKELSTGVYEATDGSGMRINSSGVNWLLYCDGEVVTFNAKGQPVIRNFEDGTSLAYSFDSIGRLNTITHSSGRALVLNYLSGAGDAPLNSVSVAGFALVTYGYTDGRLTSATYGDNKVRAYVYEDSRFPQHLTGIVAEDNRRLATFAYDAKGRSICSVQGGDATCNASSPGVNKSLLSYTANGGAVVTDALGRVSTYGLTADEGGKPRQVNGLADSTAGSSQTYYDYSTDFRRRLDTATDRRGFQTKHTYDEGTDPITSAPISIHTVQEAVGQPETRTTEKRRDLASNRLVVSKIGNRETRVTRNARFQPTSVTVKDLALNLVRTTTYTYCEAADVSASNSTCPILGLLKSVDGPRTSLSDVTRYTYYPSDDTTCASSPSTCPHRKGDLWKVTNALGHVTEIVQYGGAGRIRSIKDANGVITDFEYTPRGWLSARKVRGTDNAVETDDRITRIDYWLTGQVKQVTQPSGAFITYAYDTAQRLTDIGDNSGNTIHYTLDNAGNRWSEETKDPGGSLKRALSRIYNTLGQLETQADAQGNPTDFTYDDNGNPDKTTDTLPVPRTADQNYDGLNRLSRVLQNEGGALTAETQFKYDVYDNLTKVTDPKSLDTIYTYDAFNDRLTLQSPDTGTTSYTYDLGGNRNSQTDARQITVNYRYDALNRLITVMYPTTTLNVTYSYDVAPGGGCPAGETFLTGQLTQMTDASGSTQYCYDRFGMMVRKTQTTNGKTFTLRYAYTRSGHLSSLTYPDGAVVDYVRDAQERVTEVGAKPAGGARQVLLNQITYYPFGPAKGWVYGNGRSLLRSYDQDYLPERIDDAGAGGLSLGYHFDVVNRLDQISDGNFTTPPIVRFGYDLLDRLSTTQYGASNAIVDEYKYDATGNRLSYKNGGVTSSYVYPATDHRLASVAGVARGYDAAGNTTQVGGTAPQFVYDDSNRLGQLRSGGAATMNYAYNGRGEQVGKYPTAGASGNTYTLYDESGHWIGDYDSSGTVFQQAIWLDDLPVGLLLNPVATDRVRYIEPDHLGTPRVVIHPTRNVAVWTWSIKSEPFGNSLPNQDPDGDGGAFVMNMRFPGQRYDAASGLNQNGYRDFEAATGRYPESDPTGLNGGVSTYAYAMSQPLLMTDELGLQSAAGAAGALPPAYAPPGQSTTPFANTPPAYDSVYGLKPGAPANATINLPQLQMPSLDNILRSAPGPAGLLWNVAKAASNCPDEDDAQRCDKEWREARRVCRQLIYEQMQQAAGRRKKRSVTGVTGGYTDVEQCARGLVSQQCGGNKVR